MLNLLTDWGDRCAVLDCHRAPHGDSMWCLPHYREFARELPAEAIADTIPLETIMPNRNTVSRFPNSRTIMDEREPLFDRMNRDDWRIVRKLLVAIAVIGAFVAWVWWKQ